MTYVSSLTSKIVWLCHCQINEAEGTIHAGLLVRGTDDVEAILVDPDPDLDNSTQYRVALPAELTPQQFNVTLKYETVRVENGQ